MVNSGPVLVLTLARALIGTGCPRIVGDVELAQVLSLAFDNRLPPGHTPAIAGRTG